MQVSLSLVLLECDNLELQIFEDLDAAVSADGYEWTDSRECRAVVGLGE
jgi:hypothetical protein